MPQVLPCLPIPGAFNTKVYYNSLKIKGKIKPDSIKIIKADYDKILSYTGKLSDMLENNYKKICSDKYSSVFFSYDFREKR